MSEEATKVAEKEEKQVKDTLGSNRRMEAYMRVTAISTSAIVIAIAFLMFYFVRRIMLIFALAFLASYIISPAVRFFEKRKVNRLLIVSLLYLAFVAIVVVSTILLLPMLWGELKDLQMTIQETLSDPEFGEKLSVRLEDVKNRLAKTFPVLKDVDIGAQLNINKGISGAASWLLNYVGQAIKTISTYSGKFVWMIIVIILIPFITFFLLKDGTSMKQAMIKLIPSRYSETVLELLQNIDRQIGRYIRGRIAESIILSALTIIGLRILGVKYYLVIGGIAGFANLIPYIGPVGIAIPGIILAGYQYGVFHMVITAIFFSILQVIDNAILVPMVVGKSVDLHPIVTIFVIFVGGQLLGFLGMIIAVPLTSVFIAVFQAFHKEFRASEPTKLAN
jgi:predicted PurR-regulated permease PerM